MFNAQFLVLNAQFLVLNAQFLVFNTKLLVLIIKTPHFYSPHSSRQSQTPPAAAGAACSVGPFSEALRSDEFCIRNAGYCIRNDVFCMKIDESRWILY